MTDHERLRLAALHEYRLLDAPADDELEAVVRVAALVAGVPTATLNLIDENRQCQLSTTGFEGGDSTRRDSMCAIRFEAGEFVHVRDASVDPTYEANPWVTGALAKVRFYASAPLVTPQGYALGTLCVFDAEPGELNGAQIARLKDLAQVVLALFERRRQARINAELLGREIEHAVRRRRLAYRQTRLINELRVLDERKDAFVSTVTHELRTPLTSILGYTEMLADGDGGDLSPLQQRGVAAILRNALRLQETVADLLLLNSATQRTDAPVDLAVLMSGVCADLDRAARTRDIEISGDGAASVRGDAGQLQRALHNLVDNAIKFSGPGGRVTWRLAADGDAATVTVTDTGIGIPAGDMPGLFTPFHRAANAMHQAVQGSGLGLAIVHNIITEHGGTVAVQSHLGRGSTFTVRLPAAIDVNEDEYRSPSMGAERVG